MKKPIRVNVKNIYSSVWINIIDIKEEPIILEPMYKTKAEAVRNYPKSVDKNLRKTVKVYLVED